MKYLLINSIFLLITCFHLNAQVYKKEIIYEFEYSIEKDNIIKSGTIYLGCLGKERQTISELQHSVTWTTDKAYLKKKIRTTGIIEDEDRVWLHPPRMNDFSILEYSPFPQIKYPFVIGSSWNWELTPGSCWVSEKLMVNENDVFKYKFNITDSLSTFILPLRPTLQCFVVHAKCISPNRNSSFIGYYNKEFGFVKMTFKNIDGSVIIFNLNNILQYSELSNSSTQQFPITLF